MRSSYVPITHFINSTTQSSPPPTVEVADSKGATSSEKGEDSGNDEGDEGDEDNGEGSESSVEEESGVSVGRINPILIFIVPGRMV